MNTKLLSLLVILVSVPAIIFNGAPTKPLSISRATYQEELNLQRLKNKISLFIVKEKVDSLNNKK